jgi:pimeloyl-ACP methyl ester carboxylesterase
MIIKDSFILTGSADKIISGDLTYDDKTTNKGTVIFIHGFKGFKDWGAHNLVATYFAEKGFRYIKFNLSHSGITSENPSELTDLESFSTNTVSKELFDINAVIDYVAHTYTSDPISLIGHSRGGGLAIIKAASDNRVSNLITWSAIADFSSLWKKEQEEDWLKTGKIYVENARTKEKMPLKKVVLEDLNEHLEEYDILKAAKRIEIPWLIIHGDEDVNVKFSVAQQLAQVQLNAQLEKIEGANHVYGASYPYVSQELPLELKQVCDKTLKFLG